MQEEIKVPTKTELFQHIRDSAESLMTCDELTKGIYRDNIIVSCNRLESDTISKQTVRDRIAKYEAKMEQALERQIPEEYDAYFTLVKNFQSLLPEPKKS